MDSYLYSADAERRATAYAVLAEYLTDGLFAMAATRRGDSAEEPRLLTYAMGLAAAQLREIVLGGGVAIASEAIVNVVNARAERAGLPLPPAETAQSFADAVCGAAMSESPVVSIRRVLSCFSWRAS